MISNTICPGIATRYLHSLIAKRLREKLGQFPIHQSEPPVGILRRVGIID